MPREEEETRAFSRAHACMTPKQDTEEEWASYDGGLSPQGHRF